MKSQELRYQRQRVNQQYAKDQGKMFRKFREAIKKTKVTKNRQSHNSTMINLDLRQTSLKKSMNDFGPLFGGTHRNSSMEAPG